MAQGQGSGGSAAAKRLAEEKADRESRSRRRKDPAGRSGMGETASSNLMYKGPNSEPSAIKTAIYSINQGKKPVSYKAAALSDSYGGALSYANQRRVANQKPKRVGGY